MGRVVQIPTTPAQQALVRYYAEMDAFRAVLDILVEFRASDQLITGVFGIYRSRLRMLRRLAGGMLDEAEEHPIRDELSEFTPRRGSRRKRDR